MPLPFFPVEIILELTRACRLRCRYCTNTSGREQSADPAGIMHTISETARLGITSIRFTGGEPLLYPALQAVLEHARAKKLYTILNTSADDVRPNQWRILRRNVDCVLVSLQGPDARSNTAYTGSRSSFHRKVRHIMTLKKCIPALRLGTVLTPEFPALLPAFAALVRRIGPVSWGLFRPMTLGIDLPGRSYYRTLIPKLIRLKKAGIPLQIANPLPLCITGKIKSAQQVLAGALQDDGHSRLVRDVCGHFKPSYFINTNLGRTIRTAMTSAALKDLRSTARAPQACRQCPALPVCLGGSRVFGPHDPLMA